MNSSEGVFIGLGTSIVLAAFGFVILHSIKTPKYTPKLVSATIANARGIPDIQGIAIKMSDEGVVIAQDQYGNFWVRRSPDEFEAVKVDRVCAVDNIIPNNRDPLATARIFTFDAKCFEEK